MTSTPMPGPPPPPPVTAIDLTQFAAIVDTARVDDERAMATGLVATTKDGQPDLALKGSLMVWDKDHLACRRVRAQPRRVTGASAILVRVDRVRAGPNDIQRR